MCGIVGIYNKSGELNPDSADNFINESLLKMERRGPDGMRSLILNNNYATGFARLSIRDLSINGMQPMRTDCLNFTISFNGEIYNTDLLLKNLKSFKIKFKSSSDTEVILYHFKYFGFRKTINILDGIFAIAFYDQHKNKLYLSRDRAGVKPLYIYDDKQHLIYSSNYNQVINNEFVSNKEIDIDGLSFYLKLGYVPSGKGLFKRSYLLPQGSYVTITINTVSKIKKYFDFDTQTSTSVKDLSNTLGDAVKSQMISDVPIGTFLSGGIDSSIISLISNKQKLIKAFNISFSDKEFDESETAKNFAKNNNIDFNKKLFDDIDLKQLLEDNIAAYTEPFSDYSSLPTLLLSKFAKTKVTVALSGDGGDELFYGYDRNRKYGNQAALLTSSKVNKIYKILKSKLTGKLLKLPIYEILSNNNMALFESNFITGSKSLGKNIMPKIKKNIGLDFIVNKGMPLNDIDDYQKVLRRYEYYFHLQRVLIKVDRASMFHSLEVRVPILNNEVISLSKKYSFNACIDGNQGKLPLRNLLKNEDNNLSDLPKKGFTFSIQEIINNDDSGIIKKYIHTEIPLLDEFLDLNFIKSMYEDHINKKNNYEGTSWMLWSIFTLKSWYINHIEN